MSPARPHERRDRLLSSLAPLALFAATAACAGVQSEESGGAALVAIAGAVGETRVRVDGVERGTIGRTNGSYLLAAGDRRLELLTPGHLPLWLDLSVRAGERYEVSVQLWPCSPEHDEGCWTEETQPILERLEDGL